MVSAYPVQDFSKHSTSARSTTDVSVFVIPRKRVEQKRTENGRSRLSKLLHFNKNRPKIVNIGSCGTSNHEIPYFPKKGISVIVRQVVLCIAALQQSSL